MLKKNIQRLKAEIKQLVDRSRNECENSGGCRCYCPRNQVNMYARLRASIDSLSNQQPPGSWGHNVRNGSNCLSIILLTSNLQDWWNTDKYYLGFIYKLGLTLRIPGSIMNLRVLCVCSLIALVLVLGFSDAKKHGSKKSGMWFVGLIIGFLCYRQ